MSLEFFEALREQLTCNGSWRDLYIHEATTATWQQLLDHCRSLDHVVEFTIDGERREIPSNIEPLFEISADVSFYMEIDLAGVAIRWRFFSGDDQIELDLDPRRVTADTFPLLARFMTDAAARTGHSVFIAPENRPAIAFLAYSVEQRGLVQIFERPTLGPEQQALRATVLETTAP